MGVITDLATINITSPQNKQNTADKINEVFALVETEIIASKARQYNVTSDGTGKIFIPCPSTTKIPISVAIYEYDFDEDENAYEYSKVDTFSIVSFPAHDPSQTNITVSANTDYIIFIVYGDITHPAAP